MAQAAIAPVPDSALAIPGPLKERSVGNINAPVKIIEYASMTCPHCASFHNNTYHAFKAKYVDTGKVLFALRPFPLNTLDSAVSLLARCSPEDNYYNVIDKLFKTQSHWVSAADPYDSVQKIAFQVGYTEQSVEKCSQNQEVIDGVNAIRKHGIEVLKVSATPTFFINGRKYSGALTLGQLDAEIAKLL